MSRLRRRSFVRHKWSTMTSRWCWCNGERMQWWTRALVLFTSVNAVHAMPKILCACNVFLLINYMRNPQNGKHATTAQFLASHVFILLLLSLGVGAICAKFSNKIVPWVPITVYISLVGRKSKTKLLPKKQEKKNN